MTKFYAKYALTKGVQKLEVESVHGDWFREKGNMYSLLTDKYLHDTREAANEQASAMVVKKLASLRKQVAKLEGKVFK